MPGESIKVRGYVCHIDYVGNYKPGDLPPSGYCDWHEWATVQHNAGLRQQRCGICSRLGFPQELSDKTITHKDSRGKRHHSPVCKKCDAKAEANQ